MIVIDRRMCRADPDVGIGRWYANLWVGVLDLPLRDRTLGIGAPLAP